jgi:UDP-glucuronate 4-epimerase
MALFIFTRAMLAGKPIQIFNHGRMERDFTYIDDIVDGVFRLTDKLPQPDKNWDAREADPGRSSAPYRLYNIGNSHPVPLMQLIAVLENSLGIEAKKEFLPMQPGDVPATYADIEDLARDIGFEPRTGIEAGVAGFVSWYKEYYKC